MSFRDQILFHIVGHITQVNGLTVNNKYSGQSVCLCASRTVALLSQVLIAFLMTWSTGQYDICFYDRVQFFLFHSICYRVKC